MYKLIKQNFSTPTPTQKTQSLGLSTKTLSLSALNLLKLGSVVFASSFVAPAIAFEDLNEPQTLIYDTHHLANTKADNVITYNYLYNDNSSGEVAKVEDKVVLKITNEQEDNTRDLSLDFLTDERKIHLPNFKGRRGNPVIIGILEHFAQNMGQKTGGGALYFRNRIKDTLAEDQLEVVKEGDASSFSISPFKNDPYVGDRIELTEAVITIKFDENIPGQLQSIEYVSGPSKEPLVTRTFTFSGVQ